MPRARTQLDVASFERDGKKMPTALKRNEKGLKVGQEI